MRAERAEPEHGGAWAGSEITTRDRAALHVVPATVSRWTRSRAKRVFDVVLVLAMLPVVAPLCIVIAIAIRAGSTGPALFRQKRAGTGGTLFSIVKFRTMVHGGQPRRGSIATLDDEEITGLGRVLRYWKLDELPQLWNVLRGEMSLVGPRPRVPEQQTAPLRCRPGITGAASLAFAREEVMLAGIPRNRLARYYASRVLPRKQRLDEEYMAKATWFSDVRLLGRTVAAVWRAGETVDLANHLSAEPGGVPEAVVGEECGD